MKKILTTLLALTLSLGAAAFVGCEFISTHTPTEEWQANATEHWHTCAQEACDEKFDPAPHQWAADDAAYCEVCKNYIVDTNEEFAQIIFKDEKAISIVLANDVTVDVAAWEAKAFGGATTEKIVVYGEGKTLTFNQTNSDWNHVIMANPNGTLVLNNVKITNSGYNDGPWNRHDINFACNVELNNVTSDKAIALKSGAKFTNVTVNENNGDTYAVWIQPNGQTVEIDGFTVNNAVEGGRGIKIDQQYVDAPAKVTLKVSNATFKTNKKAAIIINSAAGADVTLTAINIAEVNADSVNAVWVDDSAADYAELVTVTGGSKILEP